MITKLKKLSSHGYVMLPPGKIPNSEEGVGQVAWVEKKPSVVKIGTGHSL